MSTQTNSDSDSDSTDTETDAVDPRLDSAFARNFADSDTNTDVLALLIAELRQDRGLRSVIAHRVSNYLDQKYDAIDLDTRDQITNIIAKEAGSSMFPYRNALVDAYLANIKPGDRVFKKQSAFTQDDDRDATIEYEVVQFQDDGTEAVLRQIARYDPSWGVLLDDSLDEKVRSPYGKVLTGTNGFLSVNVAQLQYDDSWYVVRPPRADEGADA